MSSLVIRRPRVLSARWSSAASGVDTTRSKTSSTSRSHSSSEGRGEGLHASWVPSMVRKVLARRFADGRPQPRQGEQRCQGTCAWCDTLDGSFLEAKYAK
eukprot:3664262-Prymnesium_polylepis.1